MDDSSSVHSDNVLFGAQNLDQDLFRVAQPSKLPVTFDSNGRIVSKPLKRKKNTKKCCFCGARVLKGSYGIHAEKCHSKITAEKEVIKLPTFDDPIREIKRYVEVKELQVDTKLAGNRKKSDIIRDIHTHVSPLKKLTSSYSEESFRSTTKTCNICGWTVLHHGFQNHVQKCKTKQKALTQELTLPHLDSTMSRSIKQFASSKGVKIDVNEEDKTKLLEEIEAASSSTHKKASNPCITCDLCGRQVLKTSANMHREKCQIIQAQILRDNDELFRKSENSAEQVDQTSQAWGSLFKTVGFAAMFLKKAKSKEDERAEFK
mmetsp:Transcript_11784/g.15379  ORF Transcript_11784/g.15379 Transcript_11784/m.15379 type:complete len:318 (-) Transcript_11784:156-1109(-)